MRSWNPPALPSLPGHAPAVTVLDSASGELTGLDTTRGAGVYVCGITPYDATHLGHAATYLTFDILNRILLDSGATLTYVQNVTDVDEPLLERAERDGVDWRVLAEDQVDLFRTDMEALRVLPPAHFVGAVESIPGDVEAIETLLARGQAYAIPADDARAQGEDVYLDLATSTHFGEVSRLDRADMLPLFAERGGDPQREGKRDALDPLLWRAAREGEPSWPGGTLGEGRPGWHIECTTIALTHLGPNFTVQGGGDDLIFPHHEMSAAQSRALTGQPFAQAYVHQAMVGLDGEKMSKSKGNLVLVSGLRAQGVDPIAIRLALLAQPRDTAWSWTPELLQEAEDRLTVWREAAAGDLRAAEPADEVLVDELRAALTRDLDTVSALAAVDRWAAAAVRGQLGMDAVDALLGIRLS